MILVERGNVVLEVADDLLEHYVAKGFTAKTLDGKVLKEAIPNDVGALRKVVIDQKKKIAELEDTIAKLKASSTKATDEPVIKRTRKKAEG